MERGFLAICSISKYAGQKTKKGFLSPYQTSDNISKYRMDTKILQVDNTNLYCLLVKSKLSVTLVRNACCIIKGEHNCFCSFPL